MFRIVLAATAIVCLSTAVVSAQPGTTAPLPDGVTVKDAQGRDNGVRFVDLNGDGHDDLVFSNAERYGVYLYNPTEKKNVDWRVGWTFVMREGKAGDAHAIPPVVRADGSDNGVAFRDGAMWVKNESTAGLPGGVRRIPYEELLKQPGPPPRSPEESRKVMHVPPYFVVDLVAAEPLVQDPIFIDWDHLGRLWVVEMADYPLGMDGEGKPGGRIKILEDTDHDGVCDKATVFLDGLEHPTGLAPWRDGIFAMAGGELFFAADRDGDGRAEVRETWFKGFAKGNSQHLANGLCWGLDGWFYGANGDSGGKVVSAKGGPAFDLSGRDFRFNPRTGEFQLQAGKSQCGRWRDGFGNWFGSNNSSMGWHYFMEERHLARNPRLAVPTLRRVMNNEPDNKRVYPVSAGMRRLNWPDAVNTLTSACNAMPYRDTLWGEDYAQSMFICEPANNLVHREVIVPDGVSFKRQPLWSGDGEEFLASEDPWFRPTMARAGPDGCLYVVDMYRLVLEHPEWIPNAMQGHMDLRAGEDKGRIYRVRVQNDKRKGWMPLHPAGEAVPESEQLARDLLSENGWRADTAQRRILETEGTGGAGDLVVQLGKKIPGSDLMSQAQVQVMWTLHGLKRLAPETLVNSMRSKHVRVLQHAAQLAEFYTSDPAVLEGLFRLSDDPDLRVRFHAALSLAGCPDARVPAVLKALARRDEGNRDILTALLTSLPLHAAALGDEARAWERAFQSGGQQKGTTPAPKVITNANPDREKVVRQYVSATALLTGNAERGRVLYTNVCSACHRLKGEGNEVGPDLGMVAAKPTEQILEAIFDPNRAVEMRYLTQTLTTKKGTTLSGMVTEETPNSLTVRTALGLKTVLRADLASQTASTRSLMPEGLETLLTPQHAADLLAWIRAKPTGN